MVIKYTTCEFSDCKIAPGHGAKYVEVNGKQHTFLNKKIRCLFLHSKKPLTIRWTLKWRTAHKKGKAEESKKKMTKQKKEKQVKAIVGLTLEEINKIRDQLKDDKMGDAYRFKIANEIKEGKKKYLEKQRKNKGDKPDNKNAMKNTKVAPKNVATNKAGKRF